MSLQAVLTAVDSSKTGNMKWIARDVSALTGIQQLQTGWLLCNGASFPNSAPYVSLYAYLATWFGLAGVLPDLREGKQMLAAGGGLTIGQVKGAITVALVNTHIPDHTHGNIGRWPGPPNTYGSQNGGGASPTSHSLQTSVPNGATGNPHNNMPPYTVVGGVLIRL